MNPKLEEPARGSSAEEVASAISADEYSLPRYASLCQIYREKPFLYKLLKLYFSRYSRRTIL